MVPSVRRFLDWESASTVVFVGVKPPLEALFASFVEDTFVDDLFPMPLIRALNFRLVAFMMGAGGFEATEWLEISYA